MQPYHRLHDEEEALELPTAQTIPALVREQAERRPEEAFQQIWKPGVLGGTHKVPFGEFAGRVDRTAAALRARGLGRERAAILSQGTAEFQVYALGCMAAGATPVLLPWRQPLAQLERMVSGTTCRVLLASKDYRSEAAALSDAAACLEAVWYIDEPLPKVVAVAAMPSCAAPAEVLADDCAVVLFTSGSTSTPKAVPHTHRALLWVCRGLLRQHAAAFGAARDASDRASSGTLCLLPNFHAIGFVVNFIFNLYAGMPCTVLRDPLSTPVSSSLLLEGCAALRPRVLSTVPWLLEALCEALESAEGGSPAGTLRQLQHISFAGAQLPPHCAAVLARHGVRVAVDYGQTELAGPCLFGVVAGTAGVPLTAERLQAMRPPEGVSYSFRPTPGMEGAAASGLRSGELVLHGALSATAGYLSGHDARPLANADGGGISQSYCTGDVFEEFEVAGEVCLRHCSRRDDVLVHTSGEMTNPLPIEAEISAHHAVSAACVLGDKCARPAVCVELHAHARQDPALAAELWASIERANLKQPSWSHVLPHHVVVVDEEDALPRSAKGNVQRSVLQKRLQPILDYSFGKAVELSEREKRAATWLASRLPKDEAFDSLSLSSAGGEASRVPPVQGYLYLLCIWGVVLHHCISQGPVSFPEAAKPVLWQVNCWFESISMPGFSLYAGLVDLQRPRPPRVSSLGRIVLIYAGARASTYAMAFALRWLVRIDSVKPKDYPYWYFLALLWFRITFLLTQRLANPRLRCALRWAVALAVNFGSYSPTGLWPIFYRKSTSGRVCGEWHGFEFSGLKDFLDSANSGAYMVYYLAFPYLLQAVPETWKALRSWRLAWALTLVSVSLWAQIYWQYSTSAATRGYCMSHLEALAGSSGPVHAWLLGACHDLRDHLMSLLVLCGLIYLLPTRRSWLSDAGGNSMMVYWLHQPFKLLLVPITNIVNDTLLRLGAPPWLCAVGFVLVLLCFALLLARKPRIDPPYWRAALKIALFLGGLFAQFYVCKALAELVALPMAAPSPSAGEGARRHNRARYYADVMVSDLRAPVEPFS